MKQTYAGGCQCGKVRYEVSLALNHVVQCNCSRCAKLGWLMTFAPRDDFRLTAGEDETSEFKFNKHVIHHLFCKTCGVESYAHGTRPDGAEMVAINARCLDGVDADALAVKKFDGRSI